MTRAAFVFPGQGSQHADMGKELLARPAALAGTYYRTADDLLGFPLLRDGLVAIVVDRVGGAPRRCFGLRRAELAGLCAEAASATGQVRPGDPFHSPASGTWP